MTEFRGKVEIKYKSPTKPGTTVMLDGDKGIISTGGNGTNGLFTVSSESGEAKLKIGNYSKSKALGTPYFGIMTYSSGGKRSLVLDEGISLLDDGKEVFTLSPIGLSLGSKGKSTLGITLNDVTGLERITLRPDDGKIIIREPMGRDSIVLDGAKGHLTLHDEKGKRSLAVQAFDGNTIGMWIGAATGDPGGSKAGIVAIRDHAGNDSIILDGAKGDIYLNNADCAEDFDIFNPEETEPGTVVVIEQEGKLRQSTIPYDKRVAGVISGAGDCKPGIILDKQNSLANRQSISLVGKVYCKVEATHSPIEVGDLLTTSAICGHAMKAADPLRAFGAVIGKALRPLKSGHGLIPILIALQ